MNKITDYEALRRAIDPTPEEQLIDPSPFKTMRQAAEMLRRRIIFFDQPDVDGHWLCRETISWRLKRNSWLGLRWVTVTEYAPGFIRLRNDVLADIPKKLWPWAHPSIRNFELTFHWSEFTTDLDLGGEVFRFCNAVAENEFHFTWLRFEGEKTFPQYAWSRRAQQAWAMRHLPRAQKGGH